MQRTVPVYCNPAAGGFEKTLEQIRGDARLKLEPVCPAEMTDVIKSAGEQGARRVVISGGDGTIALAASLLAGKNTELAVIPSGTLNHFADRTGIPINPPEALDVALYGRAQPVDVGYVNDTLFINTSAVGAYPVFVRSRRHLQNRMNYYPATLIAGLRRLLKFRPVQVILAGKQLHTPLVFIGVGERELRLPKLGQVKKQGETGLHLFAVDCDSRKEAIELIAKALFFGVDPLKSERHIENQLVDGIELHFRRRKRRVHVSLDGELVRLRAPLLYRFAPQEIMVALPEVT